MKLRTRLDVVQSRSLILTPQTIKEIKLLQMSDLELSTFLDQEIVENPLLERTEPNDKDHVTQPYDDRTTAWGDYVKPKNFSPVESLEQQLEQPITLYPHLVMQVTIELREGLERNIALSLIEHLDDSGYLQVDLARLVEHFNCDHTIVEAVLRQVQHFDPVGIGARSLKECLAIQLDERNRLDPAMQVLLDHLTLIADCRFEALCAICHVDYEDLTNMIHEIQSLNPKPALIFDPPDAMPIIPDILMLPGHQGDWKVIPNPETLPEVRLNPYYIHYASSDLPNQQERTYFIEQLNAAHWLIRSLRKREKTIVKVAAEIIRHQQSFFGSDRGYLKPLTLRDIATSIGMHDSTISRAISNKFIATPRGIFALKHFFSQAISKESHYSADMLCLRIRTLIQTETPDRTLSDDRLMKILQAEGIDVARRTVTKYRETMRIPSSVRRRWHNAWKSKAQGCG